MRSDRSPAVRRPRIAVVIDSLGAGGSERSLVELLPRAVDAGLDAFVITLSPQREALEHVRALEGLPIHFLDGGGMARQVVGVRRILRTESPDLVHTTLFRANLVGRIAAAGTGIPVLTSLVNMPYTEARRSDPNIRPRRLEIVRIIDGWTARHLTDHFHALTHAVRTHAIEKLGIRPERVVVVERGRDPGRLGVRDPARRAAVRARLGIEPDREVLITVGRQEYQKGHTDLMEAMALLARSRPDTLLLLAGRPGYASDAVRRVIDEHGLGDTVRLLGHREDVPDLLAASDVFVFPSLWEGIGGAVLEAMALELPIVCTDIPPLREIVEDGRTALLVPTRSPEAIAAAAARLLDDAALARTLGRNAGAEFRERFHADRSAERMVQLYRSIIAGS